MRRFKSYTVEGYLQYLKTQKLKRVITDIHLHHTWKPTKTGYFLSSDKEQVILGMWRYHTQTLGWKDIGQHLTVSPDGLVWDGRDINEIPASITGHNEKACAIEMIGNFDKGEEALEGVQLEAVIKLIRGLFEIFGTENLVFHRDHSSKTCPGTGVDKGILLEKIKMGVKIIGKAIATKEQMKQYLLLINPMPKINCSVDDLVEFYLTEGATEGVRGDVAFVQALKETGFFKYGGIVLPEQNNYAGLGALNNNSKGEAASFSTPQIGVKAHIQHLKGYASKDALVTPIVDPRYQILKNNGLLGTAPNVTDLNGKWAVPGQNYGEDILKILDKIINFAVIGDICVSNHQALAEENKKLEQKILEMQGTLDKYQDLIQSIVQQLKEFS